MIRRLDRLLLVVPNVVIAGGPFERLLGAVLVDVGVSRALGARRILLRVGESLIELLEPNGTGPVAEHLARGGGPFAVGLASSDVGALRARLSAAGVAFAEDEGDGRLLLAEGALGVPGLRLVVSDEEHRKPSGCLRFLYEATLMVPDFRAAAARLGEALGVDPAPFVPIRSDEFGYEGMLTLFDRDRLDRIEIVTPSDPAKTMGRYYAKRGPGLYMAYGECDDTAALRERLLAEVPRDWTGPREGGAPDNLWIHPRALSGLLLGVSRTTFAWSWSGRPDRVRPAVAGIRA